MSQKVEWRLNEEGVLTAYIDGVPAIWFPQPGSQEAFLRCPIFECLLAGNRGSGKCIANYQDILTDSGWKKVGDVTYEDKLVAIDGTYTDIQGIFPHKDRQLYKVTFTDGASVIADAEHRWEVRSQKFGKDRPSVVKTTKEIMDSKQTWSIPAITTPTPGEKWEGPDPYILGLLLGDGTLTGHYTTLYTSDVEIRTYAESKGFVFKSYKPNVWMGWYCGEEYRNVLGRCSKEAKYIPEELLMAGPETRLRLLQGLMDADGSCDLDGRVTASSISERLADGYVYLARSLGAFAQKHLTPPRPLKCETKKFDGCVSAMSKPIWRIVISHRNVLVPFTLRRKLDRMRPTRKYQQRAIKRIEPTGVGDATCFKVAHPRHLFVVQDFIVTHNTDVLLMDFAQYVGRGFGEEWKGILFRRTFPELDDVIGKSLKWFKKIWPKADYNKQAKTWTWPSGETFRFRHILRPSDYWSYHGSSYPWIGFEELTTWPNPDCYTPMFSLCRSSHPTVAKLCRVRATTNPYGCVPYGEVLTANRGWVDITAIQPGELIVSVDNNGVATRRPAYPMNQKYDGVMISRKGRGLNMVFTEDHRLPQLNTKGNKFSIKHFYELPGQAIIKRTSDGWAGSGPDVITPGVSVSTRKLRSKQVPLLTATQYAALLGWMLSEGCVIPRDKAFQISQSKKQNRKVIEKLLQDCGFSYRKDSQAFIVSEPHWAEHFKQFGKCRDKFIPQYIKNHNVAVLQTLLNALMLGDGCNNVYYTTSKQLADDVAEIAVKLGYAVYVSSRQKPKRVGLSYAVSLSEERQTQLNTGNHVYDVTTSTKNLNITKEKFSGDVYCLTVPGTETFFIRQNGCVWLSGNSGHNWVKKRFKLPMAAGKLTGDVIKDTRTGIRADEREKPRVAIRSSLAENKILLLADPGYVQTLRAAARNPAELAAWIEGSWDITSGGMFDDLWDEKTHIIPNIPYFLLRKSGWFMNRAYDHGQSKPFSVGWWAESNGNPIKVFGKEFGAVKGDMFLFDEYYGCGNEDNKGLNMTAQQIAEQIREKESDMKLRGRIKRGPADSAIFSKYDGMKTVAGDMKKAGVYWDTVDKSAGSRIQGWQQIRTLLQGALPVEDGVREAPGLFVCERCKDWLRTVPRLSRDDKNLDDVNTDTEDHAGDMTRYRLRWTRRAIIQRKW